MSELHSTAYTMAFYDSVNNWEYPGQRVDRFEVIACADNHIHILAYDEANKMLPLHQLWAAWYLNKALQHRISFTWQFAFKEHLQIQLQRHRWEAKELALFENSL